MVVARVLGSPEPGPWRVPLSLLFVAALAGVVIPVAATHTQSGTSNGGTYSVQFDHAGDNEWWVEVEARGLDGDSIFILFANVEGTSTWHYMKFVANDYERQQQGWSKFAPDRAFQVPTGKRVMFEAHLTDGATSNSGIVRSCWFTHPAGVEQCGTSSSSTTTTTSSTTTTTGSTFNAPFTGVRGNEWWIQANVGTNGPAITKVEVTKDGGQTWKAMTKQSWGATAWAVSTRLPQGTIVQMRATASTGQTDLSSCRQWIPPSGQDAQIVSCTGTTTPPFDATFTGVKGNEWWVQANVAGNQPIAGVAFRVDCAPQWSPLAKQSWGGWAPSYQVHIPPGSKVDFMATSSTGLVDASGGYTWMAASPTTGCALGAWPKVGSKVVYDLSSGVCGGGECFHSDATLALRYAVGNVWEGTCVGRNTHWHTDGSQTHEDFTTRLDVAPLFTKVPTSIGATHSIRTIGVFYTAKSCGIDGVGRTYVVDRQEARQTGLVDANHDPITLTTWVGERDQSSENFFEAFWDTRFGMVVEQQSYPRMSQQGSGNLYLTDTDAPIR